MKYLALVENEKKGVIKQQRLQKADIQRDWNIPVPEILSGEKKKKKKKKKNLWVNCGNFEIFLEETFHILYLRFPNPPLNGR